MDFHVSPRSPGYPWPTPKRDSRVPRLTPAPPPDAELDDDEELEKLELELLEDEEDDDELDELELDTSSEYASVGGVKLSVHRAMPFDTLNSSSQPLK
jgi:hypothetical protein